MAAGGGRHLAGAAVLLSLVAGTLPSAPGCHFPISKTEVSYRPEDPNPALPPVRAERKNELKAGVRAFRLVVPEGKTAEDLEDEAALLEDFGREWVEALKDALIFQEVIFPLRDEKVDVVLEPAARVDVAKNRFANAITVLGILTPWITGLGFDYDERVELEVAVRPGADPAAHCARFKASSEMTAERYPVLGWGLGIHIGLIILMVFESVTTDEATLGRLSSRTGGRAGREALLFIAKEFAPTPGPCPEHGDLAENTGKFCILCGRRLWYRILDRRANP